MKPQKMVARRDASPPARHCDWTRTRCQHPITVEIQPGVIPEWDGLIVIRCAQCDETALALRGYARAVDAFPVVVEKPEIEGYGV